MGGMRQSSARKLRKHPTDAERLLWRDLRLRQLGGYKFRRQQPWGRTSSTSFVWSSGSASRWMADRGFLRLRCADCAHEKLVAFSCKHRGFCPSCGARRMAETAAHLVDHVIPRVPVRQWVLSFPIPLRLLFATHPELLAPVLQIVHRVIATFLIQQAGLQRTEAHTGAVTLIQRFGSAANLNIHLHCLVLDGVYRTTEGLPVFHEVGAPTAEELQTLLARIITRLMNRMHRDVQL